MANGFGCVGGRLAVRVCERALAIAEIGAEQVKRSLQVRALMIVVKAGQDLVTVGVAVRPPALSPPGLRDVKRLGEASGRPSNRGKRAKGAAP